MKSFAQKYFDTKILCTIIFKEMFTQIYKERLSNKYHVSRILLQIFTCFHIHNFFNIFAYRIFSINVNIFLLI